MTEDTDVARHYSSGTLMSRIRKALHDAGIETSLDPDRLAPLDEFHVGGRAATVPLIKELKLGPGKYALDLGCGLGGPARYAAGKTGAAVVGVDITAEFVTAAEELTRLCGLANKVKHVHASILDLPFSDNIFDAAFMMHVGMNIADKHRIAEEAARVLKPGSVFAIYDIMRLSEDDLIYPVPWAQSPRQSAVVASDRYRFALEDAGFEIVSETNLTEVALANSDGQAEGTDGPDQIGVNILLGQDGSEKVKNLLANIRSGLVAPKVIVARLSE
ncbi:MAG: SAM-dependent methyltransferase [Rhodobacteraceae bacterium]|nr:SAM-dependent methyltransferase [Paracoccaceae bacterium]